MAWSDQVRSLDNSCLNLLGGVQATFAPQDGSASQTITGLIVNPAMADDYIPGSIEGTGTLRFFVRFADLSPKPRNGDVVSVNGTSYLVQNANPDTQGGAVLLMRKHA